MQEKDRKIQKYAKVPHILVVDDDRRIRDLLVRYLGEQDFVVMSAASAQDAEDVLERFVCDVIVLDIMMPGESGVEFATRLRARGDDVPILFLTALGEAEDRIAGLESGADDYLVKPFEPRELVLRLHALLKRVVVSISEYDTVRIGELIFEINTQYLRSEGGGDIQLTSAEATLLSALAIHAGEVLSREDLAKACDMDAGERTIDVQMTRLRRKIEADTKNPRYLQTVRGKGYRLLAQEAFI